MIITLADQISAAKREWSLRNRTYPSLVSRNKMTHTQMNFELGCMQAIIDTLEQLINQGGAA